MDYRLEELIDIPLLQSLLEKLNVIYSFPSAILDNDGKILTAVAWQDICTKFHRINPQCEKECIKSDRYILEHLHEASPAISYTCPHGLIDNAIPIIIDGKHLGNLFTGQFFLDKPDPEFFKKQAKKYGFEEAAYLEAVEKVPIWTREKLDQYLDFIKSFIEIIAGIGLNHLKEIRTRQIIRQNEEELHLKSLVLDQIKDRVTLTDMQGNIIYVNHAQVDMLEYSREELLSAKIDIFGDDPVHNIRQQDILEMTLQNGAWRGEIINYTKQGKACFLDCRTQVITNSDGKSIALCGIATDISTQKLLEKELIVAKEKAEESDRLKSAFLANMSHEIRTPMNGILGFAGLLKEPGITGKEQQEYLNIIEKSGKRMLSIIHDIVDISKIESGQMEIHISTSNINEQVEFIYNFFLPEVEQKGMKISYKNSLPYKEAMINTDREKIYAILTNLVKNAIKYTHAGSIEFGYNEKEEFLEFFVKDTGIGIAGNRHQAIFERFVQADISGKNAYEGAGLGLSIAKAYVEMLGGKIWVESKEGKGTEFFFTIPYHMQDHMNIMKDPSQKPAVDSTLKKLTILIAEDDETSELLITALFKKISKNIFRAVTGIEAVRICRENPEIDLVLMDIRMPEMNGYEATRKIRQFNIDIIIFAQTAHGLSGDREIALEAGCNDYVSKPINRDTLMALLEKYFNPQPQH